MPDVTYGGARGTSPKELKQFYTRLKHDVDADAEHFRRMIKTSAAFVTARVDGQLVGVSRGVCDGVRGYLTECKLDPAYQGPAAVTRTDGRVEHDSFGIAAEMARRVLDKLHAEGVHRIDVLAWGTEVDFLEELGFKRKGGLVGMTMTPVQAVAVAANAGSTSL